MTAAADACTCTACSFVCRGNFSGCEEVWARGPVAASALVRYPDPIGSRRPALSVPDEGEAPDGHGDEAAQAGDLPAGLTPQPGGEPDEVSRTRPSSPASAAAIGDADWQQLLADILAAVIGLSHQLAAIAARLDEMAPRAVTIATRHDLPDAWHADGEAQSARISAMESKLTAAFRAVASDVDAASSAVLRHIETMMRRLDLELDTEAEPQHRLLDQQGADVRPPIRLVADPPLR